MGLKNLTPHAINLALPDGSTMTIPPEGEPARCTECTIPAGTLDGIPLIQKRLGDLQGLPPAEPGTIYIVSLAAAQKAWADGRDDVMTVGETVRDGQGRVIAAKSLACRPG